MATLTTGTVNFGDDVFWNPRPLVRDIATRIKALGIGPRSSASTRGWSTRRTRLAKEGLHRLPGALRLRARRAGGAGGAPRGARLHDRRTLPAGLDLDLRGDGPAPAAVRRARGASAAATRASGSRTTSTCRRACWRRATTSSSPRRRSGRRRRGAPSPRRRKPRVLLRLT